MTELGKLTAAGGDEVEARIAAMVLEARDALAVALEPAAYRAVVLIGGYGRGEGGVDVREGREEPNNNFDFLIVSARARGVDALRARASRSLAPLIERHGIGMDVGVVSERALRRSPCLVMWYDMRYGHVPLLGDARFVRSLERFRVERIVPWDVRNLMVNRGTLLVINEVLRAQGPLDDARTRAAVRHRNKAIIGYGDALLFYRGDYDFSYRTKQRRMAARSDVPAAFKALYDEAMQERFRPRYALWSSERLAEEAPGLLSTLARIHLECEAARLGAEALDWDSYAERAFAHELADGLSRPRSAARKALALARGFREPVALRGRRARLGWRAARPRERLPILYPAAAFETESEAFDALARRQLDASGSDRLSLRRAYLRRWGQHGDVNFPLVLRKLGIDLEPRRPA